MRRRGVLADGALLCDEILRDLETVLGSEEDRLLTLREASAASGYSEEHLGRLFREGKLRNAGRKGSPRIRTGDLPRRPRTNARSENRYDAASDARELASRRRR